MYLNRQLTVLALFLAASACAKAETPDQDVRPPCCAGSWYPGEAGALAKLVDSLLEEASPPPIKGKPLAVICPHAGYRFSAPVAAAAYKTVKGRGYQRVLVLAFSHRYAGTYHGVDVPGKWTAYRTPLGDVPIDRKICDELLKSKLFSSHGRVGREEHSLELQLPFLQRTLSDFKIVPLLVGMMSVEDYAAAAKALLPFIDEQTLLVVSSDFTHFGPNYGYRPFQDNVGEKLEALAEQAYAPLENADFDGFLDHLQKTKDTICGRVPILLLLRILSMRGGAVGVRAAMDLSGKIMDDWTNSVTYQSVVFVARPSKLGSGERQTLLRLARQAITAYLNRRDRIRIDETVFPQALKRDGACFVTLRNRGQLRGCIGNLVAAGPLWKSVVQNAVMACQDYRFQFHPVTAKEMDEIELEVSYLTPLQRLESPEDFVIGRDGLYLEWGGHRGVLLPQVAYEPGWTRKRFLEALCMKAGVASGTWKRKDAALYSFQAEVFSEHEVQP